MAGIFINYRRDDAPGVAGRLFDHLAARFSKDDLFMDVDAMKPGMDFSKQLDTQVSQCRVLLAVIGPHWLDAKDKSGVRRLDSDKDYVRIELASALKRDIAVIPVLVDGATMPPEESLSEDLKPLAFRHALELRHTRFSADADAIVHALEAVVPRRRTPWPLIGAAIAAVLVIAAGGLVWKLKTKPAAAPPAVQTPAVAAAKPAPASPPAAPSVAPQPAPAAPPTQAAQAPSATPSAAPSGAAQAGLPPGMKLSEIMPNVAFRGSLYRIVESADPPACQATCRSETKCVAWTYTAQRPNDTTGHCSLKAVIPQQFVDACCTSGIERVPDPELRVPPPIPSGVTGALAGVELEGNTYRYFPDATIEGCQAACRGDTQCMAWDYVRPGVFTSDARCFLKNKASMEVASPCCVAGFERQPGAAAAVPPPAAPPAIAASATALPPGVKIGTPMPNTALPGSIFNTAELPDANACKSACVADSHCVAWTFFTPRGGPNGRCAMKPLIPAPSPDACCTSGVERKPPNEFSEPPPLPAGLTGAMRGVDLVIGAMNYRTIEGAQATPAQCQQVCNTDAKCMAWSYVRPGVLGAEARCVLKSTTPSQTSSACCISGFKQQASAGTAAADTPATPGAAPMINTDLRGASYRNFELASDSWQLCQSACKADNQCLAWTYVHPGLQGPSARCWLKNSIPPASANNCCTSGIERAAAK